MNNRLEFLRRHLNSLISLVFNNNNSPSKLLLETYYRNNRAIGSTDRKILSTLVYFYLRNYFLLQVLIQHLPSSGLEVILHLLVGTKESFPLHVSGHIHSKQKNQIVKLWNSIEEPHKKAINELFRNSKIKDKLKLYTDIEDFEKKFISENKVSILSDTFSLPEEWILNFDHLTSKFKSSKKIYQFYNSLIKDAPLFLRVNTSKISKIDLIGSLELDYPIENYPLNSIKLLNKVNLKDHKAVLNGFVEFQDLSSQYCASILDPNEGELILDACSGSGGKSLNIADLANDQAEIHAFDISEERLKAQLPRLKRNGFKSIKLIFNKNNLSARYDKILLDVPCTGSGTIRRQPEIKLRITNNDILHYQKKQREIIDEHVQRLRPGGHILYSTCSLFKQENTGNNIYMQNEHGLEPVSITDEQILKEYKFISHLDNEIYITPDKLDSDGFYICLLKKPR